MQPLSPEDVAAQVLAAWGYHGAFAVRGPVLAPGVADHGPTFAVALRPGGTADAWAAAGGAGAAVAPADPSVFIANGGRNWPSSARLEARLAAVARAAVAAPLGAAGGAVRLSPPCRLTSGRMTTTLADGVRYFVVPVARGRTLQDAVGSGALCHGAAVDLLSTALGGYHAMVEAAGPPRPGADVGDAVRDVGAYVADMLAWYRAEEEEAAARASAPASADGPDARRHRPLLKFAVDQLAFATDAGRVAELDALPRTWIHDDFQLKNVMWDPPAAGDGGGGGGGGADGGAGGGAGGARLTAVDLSDGSFSPRLFDFWYVLTSGEDDCAAPAYAPPPGGLDAGRAGARLRRYVDAGGRPLSPAEATLLINALMIKGCAVARYYRQWARNDALFEMALAWAAAIREGKDALRAAAAAAGAAGVAAS
jgi:hypothetical protein